MKVDAKMGILIIEDSGDERLLEKTLLTKKGFKNVMTAADGLEGLKKLEDAHVPVEIIIADWDMPNLNGLELLEKLREDDKYSEIPFIMTTAYNDRDHVMDAISSGVTSYLVKPFSANEMMKKIVEALSRAGN